MIHRFGQVGGGNPFTAGQDSLRSSVEQQYPLLQQHDPNSPDMAFANKLAGELIAISGANVTIYLRTNNTDVDVVWEEDADPTYGAGHHLKAYFAPKPLEATLTEYGVDVPNQTEVIFSRAQLYAEVGGRMMRAGDIIVLPYNSLAFNPDKFRVLNAFDSGNFRYDWLYFSCTVENITDDITIDTDNK
jgi:hypothetical protein